MLGCGIRHIAQAGEAPGERGRSHDVFANQPVCLFHILIGLPLPKHGAEHIGHAFVESAGLIRIREARGKLRHPMGELVTDHVVRRREVDEDRSVAVPIGHLAAIPESVVVTDAVMNGRK